MSEGYQRLFDLLAETAPTADTAAPNHTHDADGAPAGAAARLYWERRRRERWFGARLFWEPSWDILLFLYACYEDGEEAVPVSRLAELDVAVSADSVARWIGLLSDQKLVAVAACDNEPASLSLTQHGRAAMVGYLRAIAPKSALRNRPRVS